MTLIRRKPFVVNSIFDELFEGSNLRNDSWRGGASYPAVNIIKSNEGFEIDLAAPGIKKSDFKIEYKEGTITISSDFKNEKEDKNPDSNYTRKEFSYNSFSRSFTLPKDIDEEKINAIYEGGILKVKIPISKERIQTPKQIVIG